MNRPSCVLYSTSASQAVRGVSPPANVRMSQENQRESAGCSQISAYAGATAGEVIGRVGSKQVEHIVSACDRATRKDTLKITSIFSTWQLLVRPSIRPCLDSSTDTDPVARLQEEWAGSPQNAAGKYAQRNQQCEKLLINTAERELS